MRATIVGFAVAVVLATAGAALADDVAGPPSIGVPPAGGISSPGLLGGFFDTSRLHISNSLVFSSGFGSGPGTGSRSMAFTTLAYDVSGPVSASVTFGNRLFGAPRWAGDTGRMTLESMSFKYKPNNSLSVNVQVMGRNTLPYLP